MVFGLQTKSLILTSLAMLIANCFIFLIFRKLMMIYFCKGYSIPFDVLTRFFAVCAKINPHKLKLSIIVTQWQNGAFQKLPTRWYNQCKTFCLRSRFYPRLNYYFVKVPTVSKFSFWFFDAVLLFVFFVTVFVYRSGFVVRLGCWLILKPFFCNSKFLIEKILKRSFFASKGTRARGML